MSAPLADARSHGSGLARYWLRAAFRRRWRAWLVLGVLVGLLAGGVIAALAAARRTESSYERFLDATDAWDVASAITCDPDESQSGPAEFDPPRGAEERPRLPSAAAQRACLERLRAIPTVADATSINNYGAQLSTSDGTPLQPVGDSCYNGPGVVILAGDPSGRFGTEINRFEIVDGRAADPAAVDEVVLSRAAAQRLGLRPGDVIDARLVPYDACLDDPASWPPPEHLEVVGISVAAWEVQPSSGLFLNFVTATPAFVAATTTDTLDDRVVVIRLRDGGDEEAVAAFVEQAAAAGIDAHPQLVQTDYQVDLERSIDPSAQALWILGALGAAAGVAVLGQLLMRETMIEAVDLPVVRSFGSSRAEQFRLAAVWAIPASAVAACTALLTAVACSWFAPIGVARVVEPDPGLDVDGLVVGIGVLATAVAVLLLAAIPAARLARSASDGTTEGIVRPSRAVTVLAQAGLPAPAVTGVRMAVEPGRGRSAVPVRTGLLTITLGVLALTAAVAFGAGLTKLLDTPRLVGWNWEARVSYPYDAGSADEEPVPLDRPEVVDALAAHPGVAAYGIANIFTPGVVLGDDDTLVSMVSIDAGAGTVGPSLVAGRAPSAPDELLLGPVTADDLGIGIGDEVVAHGQPNEFSESGPESGTLRMEVVGLGILPLGGDRLGTGVAVSADGLRALSGMEDPDSILLRFAPGADPSEVVRELTATLGLPEPDPADLAEELSLADQIPVLDIRHIEGLPLLLGALMALMSAAVLAHLLTSATSARRQDIALLRAIGFDRRQVRRSISWQAGTIVAIAIVIGVPLGIVVGRSAWLILADRLGVVPEADVPTVLLALVPALLLAALLIAVVPGRLAARRSPAAGLRAE